MARVVLLTGGNVGDVKERLRTAQRLVNARIGAVLRCSHCYGLSLIHISEPTRRS